jgi:hypothetical protein
MAFDAFISYSHEDKAVADAACATLENAGTRCWIAPRDVPPGSQWAAAIVGAIDHCGVMVLIFSSQANISNQIHREVERAVSKGIPIIPLRIEDVTPTSSMEYFLGSIHWLDAITPPLEKHLQRLAQTVKSCLDFNPNSIDAPARSGEARQPVTSQNGMSAIPAAQREDLSQRNSAKPHWAARPRWAALGALCLLIAMGGATFFYFQQKRAMPRDGRYSGELCLGPFRNEPARCFAQGAILSQGIISGKWPALNPGVTMTLTGNVSASGDVKMELHSDNNDGTRQSTADLTGTLHDDRLNATGGFGGGRTVSINWFRN